MRPRRGHRWTDGKARLPHELLRPFAGEVPLAVYQGGVGCPSPAHQHETLHEVSGRQRFGAAMICNLRAETRRTIRDTTSRSSDCLLRELRRPTY